MNVRIVGFLLAVVVVLLGDLWTAVLFIAVVVFLAVLVAEPRGEPVDSAANVARGQHSAGA
jgi:hypothetical protein